MKNVVTAFLTMISVSAFAAPQPATSTSALTNPETGNAFLHKGFSLKTEGSSWVPVANSEASILDSVRFAAKDSLANAGFLSVRTEKVAKNASLELYTRKWMRDYPNYGFEVLSSKPFTLNGSPALVVDMLSRTKNKQIRQVILKNDDRIAVMTCIDSKDNFSKSIQQCNQIMKSFSWVSDSANTLKK